EEIGKGGHVSFDDQTRLARNLGDCRRKCKKKKQKLSSRKETFTKAETERGALEVPLKHAPNQVEVEVEIHPRPKGETELEKLPENESLVTETPTVTVRDNGGPVEDVSTIEPIPRTHSGRESAGVCDSESVKPDFKRGALEVPLKHAPNQVEVDVEIHPRPKGETELEKLSAKESLVTETPTVTMVTVPANGGPVEEVSTIEPIPRTHSGRESAGVCDSEPVKPDFKVPVEPELKAQPNAPQNDGTARLHHFVSNMVIKPVSCVHCGKKIKFLKRSMKCSDCKVVSHRHCRERCPLPCTPNPIGCPLKIGEGCVYDVLADYAPDSFPSIPPLVISCVNEIEQRGLCEAGLYRLSGSYVQVKDLKEEFLLTNMVPVLSEVKNINTVTGLLKDFLRNLKEPLLTFRLTQAFMDAAEVSDEENSFSLLYQSISDLPKANRDTLAFLVLHLQRVAESLETRMDIHNLALVFGPTIVGHAVPNPEPHDDHSGTPSVRSSNYWDQFDVSTIEHDSIGNTPAGRESAGVCDSEPVKSDLRFPCEPELKAQPNAPQNDGTPLVSTTLSPTWSSSLCPAFTVERRSSFKAVHEVQ
uniref:Rac GTPase activating protein 1 n=1 Tax=Gouania willdenowi TaxID=441366 RepID=A0A8C5E4K7_GOUWI